MRRYRRESPASYALGHFVTLELLRQKPETARRVFVHPKLPEAQRIGLEALCRVQSVPFEEDADAIASLAPKKNVYALSVFEKYEARLSESANHLLLVEPNDPGNLGTILRSAAAFGFCDVALVGRRADPFNPHVVRASLGACFLVRSAIFANLEDYRSSFAHALYPFLLDAEHSLEEVRLEPPYALLFGPEWPGLPESYRSLGRNVHIPHRPEVESLALPIAVGIALYTAKEKDRREAGPKRVD